MSTALWFALGVVVGAAAMLFVLLAVTLAVDWLVEREDLE